MGIDGLSAETRSIGSRVRETCAVTSGGIVKCWTPGNCVDHGGGTFSGCASPVEVDGVSSVVVAAPGESHTCALRSNGTVVCWGKDYSGQLGRGRLLQSTIPGQVLGIPLSGTTFSDDPIVRGATVVKAAHVTELRQAVDTLRSRAGLSSYPWTDSTLATGATPVKASHVLDLRLALRDVYEAASVTPPTYTHTIASGGILSITAADIAELRAAVNVLW
jgi:hypothetical protein